MSVTIFVARAVQEVLKPDYIVESNIVSIKSRRMKPWTDYLFGIFDPSQPWPLSTKDWKTGTSHTGGHSLSSGSSIEMSKSRCRRDLVSWLVKTWAWASRKQEVVKDQVWPLWSVQNEDYITYLTLSGSLKSSWRFDFNLEEWVGTFWLEDHWTHLFAKSGYCRANAAKSTSFL